ncbi:MAG: cation transporter [Firmicutes bacterium]|nr:cation transporter [Bacillota bacterium]
MEEEKKSGFKTLLMSVIFSSFGPIVLGLGLRVGHSSTQLSDFTRRTAELLALIVALVVYTVTNRRRGMDEARKKELERRGNLFTGFIMCVSGLSMILLTFLSAEDDKGNVIPALAIAFMGLIANSLFWRRYTSLYRREGNAILGVQARLYGAKTAVDVCVTLALAAVLAFPGTGVSFLFDRAGSVLVSLYMLYCGIRTIGEQKRG